MKKFILVFALFFLVACGGESSNKSDSSDNSVDQDKITDTDNADNTSDVGVIDCTPLGFTCSKAQYKTYIEKSQELANCSLDCKQDPECLCTCFPIQTTLPEELYVECGACGLNYSATSSNDSSLEVFKDPAECRKQMKTVWDSMNKTAGDCK